MAYHATLTRELSGITPIDGVSVRISEKFSAPAKVQLPPSYQQGNPSEILFMDYDFHLEEKVIEWSEKQRKDRQALEEAKAERLAAIEAARQAQVKLEEQNLAETQAAEKEGKAAAAAVPEEIAAIPNNKSGEGLLPAAVNGPYGGVTQGILQPTVMTAAMNHKRQMSDGKANSFNLADFENVQDPFDNLELKTLDDRAELNKMLQCAQHIPAPVAEPISTTEPQSSQTQMLSDQSSMANGREKESISVNIKDVQYPDFDSLSTPEASLQGELGVGPSVMASIGTDAEPSQEKVFILSKSFGSVSFTNKAENAVPGTTGIYPYSQTCPVGTTTASATAVSQPSANSASAVFYNANSGHGVGTQGQHVGAANASNGATNNAFPTYMPYRYSSGNINHHIWNQNDKEAMNPWLQHSTPSNSNNPWGESTNSKDLQMPSTDSKNMSTSLGSNGIWPASSMNPWAAQAKAHNSTAPSTNSGTHWLLSGGSKPWEVPTNSNSAALQSTYAKNPWAPQSNAGFGGGGLRSARSQPDLTKLNDLPVRVLPKSHTPPPTSAQNADFIPQNLNKPNKTTTGSSYSQTSAKITQSDEQLPDPYSGLDHLQKRFVNTIADMGFPRARVARATKKLGQDGKKVVDHLCLVNKLIEDGVSPQQAERSLDFFPQSAAKAKEYVQLRQRFLEIGFVGDRVHDALMKSDLDENKALDLLTAG